MSDTPKIDIVQATNDAVTVGSAVVANPKGFWRSKTFWFNIIVVATHYLGLLPPSATIPAGVAGNVALRLISNGQVSLTGK